MARRHKRRRALVTPAVVVLVVLGALTGSYAGLTLAPHPGPDAKLTGGSCRADSSSDDGRDHVADATYHADPPSPGDHNPTPAPAGFSVPENGPTNAHVVHSLEHGYVALW